MALNPKPRYYELVPAGQNPVKDYFYICVMDLPNEDLTDRDRANLTSTSNQIAIYEWSGEFDDNATKWKTQIFNKVPPQSTSLKSIQVKDNKGTVRSDGTPPKKSILFDIPSGVKSEDVVEVDYKCRTLVFENASLTGDYFLLVMVNIPNSPAQFLNLAVDPDNSTNLIATPKAATSGTTSNPAFSIFRVTPNATQIQTVNVANQTPGENTGVFTYEGAEKL